MAEKFDPSAHDKHAANPREALLADREIHEKLEAGLWTVFRLPIPSARRSRRRRSMTATARALRSGTRCSRFSVNSICAELVMQTEFNHAANNSPRSGSSKQVTPVVWGVIVVAIIAVAIWFAIHA